MSKLTSDSTSILYQESIEDELSVTLYANDIFEVNWDERLRVIKKNHLVEIRRLIEVLGSNKQLLVYFSTHEFLTISSEAREFGASKKAQEFTLANAVLIDSLAKKIIFNFFLRINKPLKPTKGFTTKQAAIEWLLQQKQIRNN